MAPSGIRLGPVEKHLGSFTILLGSFTIRLGRVMICSRSIDKPFGSSQMSSAPVMIRLGQREMRLRFFEKCSGSGPKNLGLPT